LPTKPPNGTRAGACSPPAITAPSGSPACATPSPAPDKPACTTLSTISGCSATGSPTNEPVHTWDLTGDYTRIRGTTERINPRLAWWIDTTSRVPSFVDSRPVIRSP